MKAVQLKSRWKGAILLVAGLLASALLAGAAVMSAAALTDEANLNIGTRGVGFDGRFDVGVVDPEGRARQVDAALPALDWNIEDARSLGPGGSLKIELPIFNNTQKAAAEVRLRLESLESGGGKPTINDHLLFTATLADGTEIFSKKRLSEAEGLLGVLAARESAPLSEGDGFTAGNAESLSVVTLLVEYLDEDGVENLNGAQGRFGVKVDAETVVR